MQEFVSPLRKLRPTARGRKFGFTRHSVGANSRIHPAATMCASALPDDVSPAGARSCFACANFHGRIFVDHLVCEHQGAVQYAVTIDSSEISPSISHRLRKYAKRLRSRPS